MKDSSHANKYLRKIKINLQTTVKISISTYSNADVICYSATWQTELNKRSSVCLIVDRSLTSGSSYLNVTLTIVHQLYNVFLCLVNVDKPGKPGEPECEGTTEDSITLTWEPPLKDGGKPIKGYVVEKREKGSKRWTKYVSALIVSTYCKLTCTGIRILFLLLSLSMSIQ